MVVYSYFQKEVWMLVFQLAELHIVDSGFWKSEHGYVRYSIG